MATPIDPIHLAIFERAIATRTNTLVTDDPGIMAAYIAARRVKRPGFEPYSSSGVAGRDIPRVEAALAGAMREGERLYVPALPELATMRLPRTKRTMLDVLLEAMDAGSFTREHRAGQPETIMAKSGFAVDAVWYRLAGIPDPALVRRFPILIGIHFSRQHRPKRPSTEP
jgi:hypothetical protein